jgi:hypothetical protein
MSSILIPKTMSFFFTSSQNQNNQAKSVSADGSTFSVQLDTPISIPRGAVATTMEMTQASIWNNSFNISSEINNNKFVFYQGDVWITITIPNGQYSLSALNDLLAQQFLAEGLAEDFIQIGSNEATQQSIVIFTTSNAQVDFTATGNCRDVLGFDARIIQSTAAGDLALSDNVARFNRVNSFLIRTNLIGNGIPINSKTNGIIASIPITAASGSLIVYSPAHPIQADASSLVGGSSNYFTFNLLDQEERPVNTNGESYSFVLVIRYYLLLSSDNVPLLNL